MQIIPIMLHLDHGDDHEMYRDWFDRFIKKGEEFQVNRTVLLPCLKRSYE